MRAGPPGCALDRSSLAVRRPPAQAPHRRVDPRFRYTYRMCMQEKVGKSRARLVRKQLMLTSEQNARLKRVAAATSRSEGELVREAVDDWLSRQEADDQNWKDAWRQAAGIWADRDDLDEFYAERRAARGRRRDRMNKLMRGGRE